MAPLRAVVGLGLACVAAVAVAQTRVEDPWVRGTVAGQKATGFFGRLVSDRPLRLVAARSPLARHVEIHVSSREGDVMRMRAVESVEVPAGKPLLLAPGGVHVMLLDLERALAEGDRVPVTLVLEAADGRRETLEVSAPVRPLGAGGQHLHGR